MTEPIRWSVRNIAEDAERSMPGSRCVPPAPKGNKRALKHGRYTAEAIAQRRRIWGAIAVGQSAPEVREPGTRLRHFCLGLIFDFGVTLRGRACTGEKRIA